MVVTRRGDPIEDVCRDYCVDRSHSRVTRGYVLLIEVNMNAQKCPVGLFRVELIAGSSL